MFQKRARGIKKGKKDKAGSEDARKKKKWNLRDGKSQAITKALKSIWEKIPDFQSKPGTHLSLEVSA